MKIEFENISEGLIFCARQCALDSVITRSLTEKDQADLVKALDMVENLSHEAPEKLDPRLLEGDAEGHLHFLNNLVDYSHYGQKILSSAIKLRG